jgi:hypothetical protein
MRKVFKGLPVSAPVPAMFCENFYTFVPVGYLIIIPVFYGVPACDFSVDYQTDINGKSIIMNALAGFGIGYFFPEVILPMA